MTEELKRIFEFTSLEINATNDGKTLQVIVDGVVYRLEELGAGFAQFILTLGNVLIAAPDYVLIDEPELGLHPTLQMDFLLTLASYAPKGVVYATHSYGLARATADRIYALRSLAPGHSEIHEMEGVPHLAEFLGALSYSGYRELGFDRIVMVEGPKDVRMIQQFLRKLKRDHQVVILPLAGSSGINANAAIQLAEVQRISSNIQIIIDSEKTAPDKPLSIERHEFVDTCEQLGIPCLVLERRAMEHYLSDRAVKAVKGDKYRALEPYQKREDLSPIWGKDENWRIARDMAIEELDGTDLGACLRGI